MKKHPSKTGLRLDSNLLKYYLLITIAAFAVYANSLSNEFVFDDESVVLGDKSITELSNIPRYFTAQEGFHKVIGRYYRPVVSSTYAIDYAVWGLKPFGFHLTNVIIHVINSLLFFKLLLMIFFNESVKIQKPKLYGVIFAGLIFAVHPIHTEAVAWVSGRTDSLSFTFFAASFIYYLKYSADRKTINIFFILFFFLLSLLAKEMAISLPVIIVLYDIAVNRGIKWQLIKKRLWIYISLGALAVIYLFLRWLILKDIPQRDTYFYFYGKDTLTIVYTMLQTLPVYFRLLAAPVSLLYHYNVYLPYQNSIASAEVIGALIFVVILIAAAVIIYKKYPLISFSILFVFVTLIPVMNIVPTMNFMAERFLYIPSAAFSITLAVLFIAFYSNKSKRILISALSVLTVFYCYLTYERNFDWKDNNTLFLSADGKPGTLTYVNIGNIYANNQEYDKAEVLYRKAIDLRNETLLANNNLGKIFLIKGNFDSAYFYMYKSYKLDTLSPEPMFSLAQLYSNNNKIPEAIWWLEKIQILSPNYMNSTQMLEQLKQRQLIEGKINDKSKIPAGNNKISVLEQNSYQNYQQKNYDKAIEELKELVILNPSGSAGYYNNIGISYLEQNMLNDARKYFELAVAKEKSFSTAYNNLGSVYEKLGEKEKAKENYLKAVQTDTNNQNAKENLKKLK